MHFQNGVPNGVPAVYPQCTHSLPNAMAYPKWEQELSLVKGGNPGLVLVLVVC